jgi:protein SCO1/2
VKNAALARLAGALGVALALASAAHHEAKPRVERGSKGWPVADFVLVDQQGAALARDALLDRWTFVVFGDTACLERCTPALAALATLSKRIGATQVMRDTRVLFVSRDAERDTPARLTDFISRYDHRWVAATGSVEAVTRLADELGLLGKPAGAAVVLVGPDGALQAEYLPPYDALLITADYLKVRKCRGCGP